MNVHPKVVGGGLAGAVTIVVVWAVGQFGHVAVPPEIASAFTTIVSAVVGYLVPGA